MRPMAWPCEECGEAGRHILSISDVTLRHGGMTWISQSRWLCEMCCPLPDVMRDASPGEWRVERYVLPSKDEAEERKG